MRSRAMSARTWMLAVAVAALLLVGAGVAYATGSGDDDSSEHATGPGIEKAKSVALDHVDGRVTGTEVGDEEGYYEVEITRDDGSQVDVHLDKQFDVLDTPADQDGPEDEGASEE